jgi:hypothetical protein
MFTIASSIIGDNSTDNSSALAAWITALGGAQASAVFPPGTYKITGSNLVFPSNVGVTLQPGAILSVASGKTVTFTGDLVTPHSQQVFAGPGLFHVNSANLKSIILAGGAPKATHDSIPPPTTRPSLPSQPRSPPRL